MIVCIEQVPARPERTEQMIMYKRGFCIEKSRLCRARAVKALLVIPHGLSRRRVEKRVNQMLSALRRMGVGRVLISNGFHFKDLPEEHGLSAASGDDELRRALAPAIVKAGISQFTNTNSTVAVFAARLTREVDEVVLFLLNHFRSVAVRFERGGKEYADKFYAQYGVPLIQANEALALAPYRVVLSATRELPPPRCDAVTIDTAACGAVLQLPEWVTPGDYSLTALAGELYRSGVLSASDIVVMSINDSNTLDISCSTIYNIAQFESHTI